MQICVIIYSHLGYTRMTEMLYMYVIPNFLMNSNGVFRQFTMPNSYLNMSYFVIDDVLYIYTMQFIGQSE
jgi:hypothetical protein